MLKPKPGPIPTYIFVADLGPKAKFIE